MDDGNSSSKSILESITRKSLLILINFAVLGLIGAVSWYFVANNIPKEYVGIVYFAMGFGGLFSFLAEVGFGAAHVKRISEGRDIGRCIGTYIALKLILITIYTLTVISAIYLWKEALGRGFESPEHEKMIYLMLGFYVLTQLAHIGSQTLAARVETAKQQLIPLAAAIIQLVVTLAVVLSTNDLFLFGSTFIVGAIVNFSISLYFLKDHKIKLPTYKIVKSYISFAIPVSVLSATSTLTNHIDRIMIQLFWAAEHVGTYTGGQKFSLYLIQVPQGVRLLLFPTFSSLSSKNQTQKMREIALSSERLLSLIMSPLTGIMFALAYPIVTILGDIQYEDSAYVLMPLSIWALVITLNSPYGRMIMGIGKPSINAMISIIKLLTLVILNIILIPEDIKSIGLELFGLGAAGAALATMFSALIITILYRFFSYKYIKVIGNVESIKYIVAGGISSCILLLLQVALPVNRFFSLVIYSIIGIMIYIMILIPMKGFHKQDILFFKSVLNPFEMFNYIKNEFFPKRDR